MNSPYCGLRTTSVACNKEYVPATLIITELLVCGVCYLFEAVTCWSVVVNRSDPGVTRNERREEKNECGIYVGVVYISRSEGLCLGVLTASGISNYTTLV